MLWRKGSTFVNYNHLKVSYNPTTVQNSSSQIQSTPSGFYLTSISSTSNDSQAFGGIWPPAPREPYLWITSHQKFRNKTITIKKTSWLGPRWFIPHWWRNCKLSFFTNTHSCGIQIKNLKLKNNKMYILNKVMRIRARNLDVTINAYIPSLDDFSTTCMFQQAHKYQVSSIIHKINQFLLHLIKKYQPILNLKGAFPMLESKIFPFFWSFPM